jgi:hypothetical protein
LRANIFWGDSEAEGYVRSVGDVMIVKWAWGLSTGGGSDAASWLSIVHEKNSSWYRVVRKVYEGIGFRDRRSNRGGYEEMFGGHVVQTGRKRSRRWKEGRSKGANLISCQS